MRSRIGVEAALGALWSVWLATAGCCGGAPLIVDTDMALDDVRAIALLSSSRTLAIIAVVTSDGSSGARAGYESAVRVLRALGLDRVPIGMGPSLDAPPPPWRGLSEALGWSAIVSSGPGTQPAQREPPADAVSVIAGALRDSAAPVDYVCLGPLTNLAQLIHEKPELATRIARVLYVGSTRPDPTPGWNTLRDPSSTDRVFGADIAICAFDMDDPDVLRFDSGLWQEVGHVESAAAQLIYGLHRDSRVQALLRERHFRAWDETVPLYLHDPAIAHPEPFPGRPRGIRIGAVDVDAARNAYLAILKQRRSGRP
ncbi:MAG: nucleoside hydrolase [Acidobacteriota bacterium]